MTIVRPISFGERAGTECAVCVTANKSANDNADDVCDCTYLFFTQQSSAMAMQSPEAKHDKQKTAIPMEVQLSLSIVACGLKVRNSETRKTQKSSMDGLTEWSVQPSNLWGPKLRKSETTNYQWNTRKNGENSTFCGQSFWGETVWGKLN